MFVGVYARGERQADLEREYLQVYHPIDEAVPRLRQLPDRSDQALHEWVGPGHMRAAIVEEAGRHAGYAPDFVFNSASCSVRNARISSVMASNVIHCSL